MRDKSTANLHVGEPGASRSANASTISDCLVHARIRGERLAQFPGALPDSLEQAYAIQSKSIARWPEDVAGWKVARLPVGDRERFGSERLAGPVFGSTVSTVARCAETVAQIFGDGFAAIEAEFVFELGVTVSPGTDVRTDDDLAALVSRAYCGAEIASSPVPKILDLGAVAIIADFGLNAGVVVGPEIADFRTLPAGSLVTRVSVDGHEVGSANPGPITGDPVQALRFLLDHCARRGIELPKGTLVSTGLLTGVHAVDVGSVARVDFGPQGWFDVRFEAVSRR